MKRFCAKRRAVYITVLFFACFFALQSCAIAIGAKELCLSFVEGKMMDAGGVFTNYLPSEEAGELAVGHSVLLESQGLILSYYTREGSGAMANEAVSFVNNMLDTGRILSYRLDEDGGRHRVNAAVDDLRFIGALLDATDTFGRADYRDQAIVYAKRLYDTNVKENMLLDFFDEQYGITNTFTTLCYLDLYTMKRIAAFDERWLPVIDKMRATALGGYLGDTFPMFQTRFDWEKCSYESRRINMVESLLTMYHLSLVDSCPKTSLGYLKLALQNGELYAVYNTDGTPHSDVKSTAVYALCALIGASEEDGQLYQAAISHMLPFQVADEKSPVHGAFADAQTLAAYSFDNLMALLALQAEQVLSDST